MNLKIEKKGISLIVLIITIIVIIILAGAVILSLTNTDILGNSKKAKLKSNLNNYKEELSLNISDAQAADQDLEARDITTTTDVQTKVYIPSMQVEDEGKYLIQNGEIAYTEYTIEDGIYTNIETGITELEKTAIEEIGIKRYAETLVLDNLYTILYINPHPIMPDILFKKLKTEMINIDGIYSTDDLASNISGFNIVKEHGQEGDADYEEFSAMQIYSINTSTGEMSMYGYVWEQYTTNILR